MNNTTFSFTIKNTKAPRYFFMGFGIAMLGIFTLFWGVFWIPIIICFVAIITGMVLTVKNNKIEEVITLHEDYIDSQVYGEIRYDEIQSADKPFPSITCLKLVLKSGRKVLWTAISGDPQNEDTKTLEGFIRALSAVINREAKDDIHRQNQINAKQEEEDTSTPETQEQSLSKLGNDLKSLKNKKRSGAAIPAAFIGLAVALAGFLMYNVFPKLEKERNERAMAPVRQAVTAYQKEKNDVKDSLQKVLKVYEKEKGPFYLFSNDTGATIAYLPRLNLHSQPKTRLVSLVGDYGVAKKLKHFLAHPDFVSWDMAMVNGFTSFRFGNGWFDSDDSSKTIIFWGAVDTTFRVAHPGPYNDNHTDSVTFQSSFATVIDDSLDFEGQILTGMQRYMRLFSKHPHTMKFYVAVRGTQMDKARFDKAVKTIEEELKYFGADVSKFKIKTFGQE